MKRAALLLCLAGLAGCSTDSANSLSRDYRNLNNEAIDALMMSTTEARAKLAKDKIIGTYGKRLQVIDKRFTDWDRNVDDKLIMLETLTSDSVATLLADIPSNRRRLKNEQDRLKTKIAFRANEIAERMRAGGNADPAIMDKAREEAKKEWPILHEFAAGTGLSELKTQLDKGNRFFELIPKFLDEKDKRWNAARPPGELFKQLTDVLENRRKALEPAG